MQKTIIFLLLILKSILLESQNISSGLYFAAHSAIKEERTSLTLSPDFDASKGFTLDFDIKFRSEEHNYGYVFRIIIDDERSFDLIANITRERKR
jgi:endo-1,4-beta-D-glucanase Y